MKSYQATRLLVGAVAVPILGYCWLSLGVFTDREFGSLYLFKKHRPSPRFFFYAPVGESDTPVSSLAAREQRAEADFKEFVESGGGYHHKFRLFR